MDNKVAELNPNGQLDSFFQSMFGPHKGYIYCPVTEPQNASECDYHFFKWPDQEKELVDHVLKSRAEKEVYFSPVLFKKPELKKENLYGTKYLWAEFNGETPEVEDLKDFPTPSFKIRTSQKGHEYWFWELQFFQKDMKKVEDLLKRVSHHLKADLTTWHYESVLRLPNTIHHRYGTNTYIFEKLDVNHPEELFHEIPDPPKYLTEDNFLDIPPVSDVIAKYSWNVEDDYHFFTKRKPTDADKPGTKFRALTRLAFICAEMGMQNPEILSILMNADERWGHYSDRKEVERKARLIERINHVRLKKPLEAYRDGDNEYPIYSFGEFMAQDFQVEWALEPFVQKAGMTMLTGDSNVGKTRFSLLFCIHMALGKEFLGWKCPEPMKIQFWSLEMAGPALKNFLGKLTSKLTEDELKLLNENFFPVPIGHSVHLDKPSQQPKAKRLLQAHKPDGVIIDSLGVALQTDIENQEKVNAVLEFVNKEMKNELGAFVIWIHHHRKHGSGKPSVDDVFGSVYLRNQMDSIFTLHRINKDAKNGDILEVTNPKQRMTEVVPPFKIRSNNETIGYDLLNPLGYKAQQIAEKGVDSMSDDELSEFLGFDD